MIRSKRLFAAGLVATLSLTAAACGGDDDDSASDDVSDAAADVSSAEEEISDAESAAEEEVSEAESSAEEDMSEAESSAEEEMSEEASSAEEEMSEAESSATEEMSEDTAAEGDGATVGLLFDITGRGDQSFNDAAAAGLDQAEAELGILPSESTPTGDADRAQRLDLLVDADNNLVIGVGFLWTDALAAGAIANPETHFALIDSVAVDNNGTPDDPSDDVDLENVANLLFAEEQGSFLVGAAAAQVSQTGTIGFVGGVETDLIKKFEAGYQAGAEAVNPDIEVLVQYASQPPDFTGFNAPDIGKEIAAQMYSAGADVVYHAAGATGLGVFAATAEAGEPGEVWAIGVDSDQYLTVDPEIQPYILTSMLKRVDVATYDVIEAEVNGSFTPGIQVYDLSVDGVGYSTSGDNLPQDVIDQLEDFKAQIIAGEIEVPSTPA